MPMPRSWLEEWLWNLQLQIPDISEVKGQRFHRDMDTEKVGCFLRIYRYTHVIETII